MPRDGALQPPTREEIIANIRQQSIANFIEQIINLEADKAMLTNDNVLLRQRIAQLESTIEAINANAAHQ